MFACLAWPYGHPHVRARYDPLFRLRPEILLINLFCGFSVILSVRIDRKWTIMTSKSCKSAEPCAIWWLCDILTLITGLLIYSSNVNVFIALDIHGQRNITMIWRSPIYGQIFGNLTHFSSHNPHLNLNVSSKQISSLEMPIRQHRISSVAPVKVSRGFLNIFAGAASRFVKQHA